MTEPKRQQEELARDPFREQREAMNRPVLNSSTHPCLKGHDFQPRHDMRQVNHLTEMVYVRDVCVRCGETVERPQKLRDY